MWVKKIWGGRVLRANVLKVVRKKVAVQFLSIGNPMGPVITKKPISHMNVRMKSLRLTTCMT
jgi:hypothetical protein